MNWRRGLLFALVHMLIAVPLVVWQEAHEWTRLRARTEGSATFRLAAFQEQQVTFDSNICYWSTPQETILTLVNMPASIIAGRHVPRPSRFTVDGVVEVLFGRATRRSSVLTAFGFVCLVFLQWLLIGARPLIRPKHWWLEPAMLVTICAVVSICLLRISRDAYEAPLLIASGAWFVWLCLVLLKLVKLGWRSVSWRHLTQ
jgi:hypothetical protein